MVPTVLKDDDRTPSSAQRPQPGWSVFFRVIAVLNSIVALVAFGMANDAYKDNVRSFWWMIFWICIGGTISAGFIAFLVRLFVEIRDLLIDMRASLRSEPRLMKSGNEQPTGTDQTDVRPSSSEVRTLPLSPISTVQTEVRASSPGVRPATPNPQTVHSGPRFSGKLLNSLVAVVLVLIGTAVLFSFFPDTKQTSQKENVATDCNAPSVPNEAIRNAPPEQSEAISDVSPNERDLPHTDQVAEKLKTRATELSELERRRFEIVNKSFGVSRMLYKVKLLSPEAGELSLDELSNIALDVSKDDSFVILFFLPEMANRDKPWAVTTRSSRQHPVTRQ